MKAYSLQKARRLVTGTRDWREAVWNRWLVGYLTPREESSDGGEAVETASSTSPSAEPEATADGPAAASAAESPGSDGELGDGREVRGSRQSAALRVRLDRMLEQMDVLELTVDRIAERQSVAASHDRLQLCRVTDLLDRLVENQERHTETLIACTRAVERMERRMMSVERSMRELPAFPGEAGEAPRSAEPRVLESMMAPAMSHGSPMKSRSSVGAASSAAEPNTAPLSGKLSDISLSTLLSMAELERWTGRLTLETETHMVQVDLEGGLLVGVLEDDSPTDAVEALHELIDKREGRFSFSPNMSVVRTELAPMTVGTLLLRASHRRDELGRADVGS